MEITNLSYHEKYLSYLSSDLSKSLYISTPAPSLLELLGLAAKLRVGDSLSDNYLNNPK